MVGAGRDSLSQGVIPPRTKYRASRSPTATFPSRTVYARTQTTLITGIAAAGDSEFMNAPHIIIKRESSTWNGWCVHYAGMFQDPPSLERKTHCHAGVEYASVAKQVDYTYSREDGHKYNAREAHPCFRHEHPLTDGCAQCRFPTPEEIKAHDEELNGEISKMIVAHNAIVEELNRRLKAGDGYVKLNQRTHSDFEDDEAVSKDYVSGAGVMDCPVCKSGKLQYSCASVNGHVHARCSTAGCVAWMQ